MLTLMAGCSDSTTIKESVSPCEDEYKNDLVPIKQIETNDFLSANFFLGSRASDKYLVLNGNISRSYKYVIINHQAQTLKYFERPYTTDKVLSECKLYQIHNDHLYLARYDNNGWVMEAIHLESLDSEDIPIMLGNEKPREILQVEKYGDVLYILATFEKSTIIFAYTIADKTMKVIYTPSDALYTLGFKILPYDSGNDFILRVAIDETNYKTIIEGVSLDKQEVFYSSSFEGIIRKNNYPFSTEILPFDLNGRLYLNFATGSSAIIEAKTGRTISTSEKQVLALSSDYAFTYKRFGNDIDPSTFTIINPTTGELLIDARWEKYFHNAELIDPNHLLIYKYYDSQVLNLETKCIEYKMKGEFYRIKENEFVTFDIEGLNFYKL